MSLILAFLEVLRIVMNILVVHNKVFDGSCDMCLGGFDMLCRNGGLIGAITNGGFAEYISVPERNVFRVPDGLNWEVAAAYL